MDGNGVDINNDNTLVLKGNNILNDGITGSGDATVQDGKTTLNGNSTQGTITIGDDNGTNAELENKGSLTVEDLNNKEGSTFDNNGNFTADKVVNDGTLENDSNGTVIINDTITNNGTLDNDGTFNANTINNNNLIDNDGTISVDNLNNKNKVDNDGTINADTITNKGTVDNDGNIIADNITNTGTVNNKGSIEVNDTLTNNLNITNTDNGTIFATDIVNNNGGVITSKADNISTANAIANDGTLNLTGGVNVNDVTGNGTTNFSSDSTNNANITQDKITNKDNLINNGAINGTTENNGSLINNKNGYLSDLVNNDNTNNKGTIDNLDNKGTTVNNGTINNAENSNKLTNNIDGTIGYLDNSGNTNNKGLITGLDNEKVGKVDNSGKITGTVNNLGLINNDNTIAADNLNNKGTINNNNTIAGDNLNNQKGGKIDNNGVIKSNDIINRGKIDNNDGLITANNITNKQGGSIVTNSEKLIASDTLSNSGTITFNSGRGTVVDITGTSTGNVNLSTGNTFVINNKIDGTQISLNDSTLVFGDKGDISKAASLNINGGKINVLNNKIEKRDIGKVNLNKNANLSLDFNVANETSDSFLARVINNGGKFVVDNITITGNTLKDHIRVHLGNTTKLGKSNVTSISMKLPSIMTPIRRIDGRLENGYVIYEPTGSGYDEYNPAVLASPIAAQVGGYLNQLHSYDEAFDNLDMKMLLNQNERKALKDANRYASSEAPSTFNDIYLPEKDSAGWSRPYTSIESVNLHNGPKVDNVMYGTYFGADSDMIETKNGWDYQWSLYGSYNGSHQKYSGNDIYQNGVNVGATGVWFKGDFFTAVTANVGGSLADASTMYGSEDIGLLSSGVATKTGYNFEFKDGKFIIQPHLLASYSFVNAFDHTSASGAKIESDPLHAINVTPGIKIIGNLKDGWQPYGIVQVAMTFMDKTHFEAANLSLPEMSVKPYVQYGVGLQKRWGDRFTGFAQTMIRSGGRNGIAFGLGFRWALGSKDDGKNIKDVHNNSPTKTKTVIKQLPNKNNITTNNNL